MFCATQREDRAVYILEYDRDPHAYRFGQSSCAPRHPLIASPRGSESFVTPGMTNLVVVGR
jgi:hypothetical protein